MLRPTATQVSPLPDYRLDVVFDNGERRIFDVSPYIQGQWFSELKDPDYFKSAAPDGFTVCWAHGHPLLNKKTAPAQARAEIAIRYSAAVSGLLGGSRRNSLRPVPPCH